MDVTGVNDQEICEEIKRLIETALPSAEVKVSGSGGHYRVSVVSELFQGKTMLNQHRLVYGAIAPLMNGPAAAVHAIDFMETKPA